MTRDEEAALVAECRADPQGPAFARIFQEYDRQLRGYLAWQVYYLTRLGSVWLPEGYVHRQPVPVRDYVADHPERLP